MLALAAVAAYALAYYIQFAFYQQFGLTPDQLGIDKLTALLRLVPMLFTQVGIMLLFATVALIGLSPLLIKNLRRELSAKLGRTIPSAGFAAAVAAFYIVALVVLWWLPQLVLTAGIVPLNPGVVLPVVDTKTLLDPAALNKAYPGAGDAMWKLWGWSFFLALVYAAARWKFRRWSGLVVVFVIVTALGSTIPGSVAEGGRRLARYGVVSLRLPTAGITVDYAAVRWIDPARKPLSIAEQKPAHSADPPNLLIIINQSPTTYAFWDCRTRQAHVVSVTDVVVERVKPPRGVDGRPWLEKGTGCDQQP